MRLTLTSLLPRASRRLLPDPKALSTSLLLPTDLVPVDSPRHRHWGSTFYPAVSWRGDVSGLPRGTHQHVAALVFVSFGCDPVWHACR